MTRIVSTAAAVAGITSAAPAAAQGTACVGARQPISPLPGPQAERDWAWPYPTA